MSVIASNYVVLDVETNGLSSLRDDLLSISIFQPDSGKKYNKFLPLELNDHLNREATKVNGITRKDLLNATPLTQEDVDYIISEFDIKNRTILTYGGIDEKFIKSYFKRKQLIGFNDFHFFNFKRNICSSPFQGGNLTKDNLCNLYGIDGVSKKHTGINDCILEWKLFEKMDNHTLIVTNDNVFEINKDYIMPAGYFCSFPNMKYHYEYPNIDIKLVPLKSVSITNESLEKFGTNIDGITFENLINSLVKSKTIDSESFLSENKKKLHYIGTLPPPPEYECVSISLNTQTGSVKLQEQYSELEKRINTVIKILKENLSELVCFIKEDIFKNEPILNQELVTNENYNILALCDLSNLYAVLEIKSFQASDKQLDNLKIQMYYQARGRKCYVLETTWALEKNKIIFTISEVSLLKKEQHISSFDRLKILKNTTNPKKISVVNFFDTSSPVILQCQKCGHSWKCSYQSAIKESLKCPLCSIGMNKENLKKHLLLSKINLIGFFNNQVILECQACNHQWKCSFQTATKKSLKCPLCDVSIKKDNIKNHLLSSKINLIDFSNNQVILECQTCNHQWKCSYQTATKESLKCPLCDINTKKENLKSQLLSSKINPIDFTSNQVVLECQVCNHQWNVPLSKALHETPKCLVCSKRTDNLELKYELQKVELVGKLSILTQGKLILRHFSSIDKEIIVECIQCGNQWHCSSHSILSEPYCHICNSMLGKSN